MKVMVLSILGEDRPGLIDDLAKAVNHANGNWLRSSFCKLSGRFAGFVEVSIASENEPSLVSNCQSIHNLNINIQASIKAQDDQLQNILVSVTGNDRTGIVADVSQALVQLGININKLETTCESAPNWGNQMFKADFTLEVKQKAYVDDIRQIIENIADDLMVDIETL